MKELRVAHSENIAVHVSCAGPRYMPSTSLEASTIPSKQVLSCLVHLTRQKILNTITHQFGRTLVH